MENSWNCFHAEIEQTIFVSNKKKKKKKPTLYYRHNNSLPT